MTFHEQLKLYMVVLSLNNTEIGKKCGATRVFGFEMVERSFVAESPFVHYTYFHDCKTNRDEPCRSL